MLVYSEQFSFRENMQVPTVSKFQFLTEYNYLMFQCLLVALIPLCSALTGTHVKVSVGGATYQHGDLYHGASIIEHQESKKAPI